MMDIYKISTKIVGIIWNDLTDRSNIEELLHSIDDDTIYEMKSIWHEEIAKVLQLHG